LESREESAVNQFYESVPKQLLRDLFVSVLTNYQQADKFTKENYPWQEGLPIRGYKRRADIEVDIRAVAAKYFNDGAKAEAEPNCTGGWYHTVLRVGEVAMVASKVRNRKSMVNKSLFMHKLAADNAQIEFSFVRTKKKVVRIDRPAPKLTAVLVHGYKKGDKSRPDFVLIRFPDEECKNWIGTIDLFAVFREVLVNFYAKPMVAADRIKAVRLRKNVIKKESEGEGA